MGIENLPFEISESPGDYNVWRLIFDKCNLGNDALGKAIDIRADSFGQKMSDPDNSFYREWDNAEKLMAEAGFVNPLIRMVRRLWHIDQLRRAMIDLIHENFPNGQEGPSRVSPSRHHRP